MDLLTIDRLLVHYGTDIQYSQSTFSHFLNLPRLPLSPFPLSIHLISFVKLFFCLHTWVTLPSPVPPPSPRAYPSYPSTLPILRINLLRRSSSVTHPPPTRFPPFCCSFSFHLPSSSPPPSPLSSVYLSHATLIFSLPPRSKFFVVGKSI